MPYTEHDDKLDITHLLYYGEHHHHLGTNVEPPEHVDLGHGKPAERVYARRGDWYAVHTH